MSFNDLIRAIERDRLREYTIEVLKKIGLKPSKRFGQNFTISIRLLREFRYHVERMKCEKIIEIGTGLGVITASIRDLCREIITIERDQKLCNYARKLFESISNIRVLCGDALKIIGSLDFCCVIGTLPYSITGPILGGIVSSKALWGVLALQKDVVDRILSRPGVRRYGSISVLVRSYFDVERGGVYKPDDFYPEPKVSTEVIVLRRFREALERNDLYERFLKCLFSQRKKLLHNALKMCGYDLGGILEDIPRDILSRRVFTLSPEEFFNLFLLLQRISR